MNNPMKNCKERVKNCNMIYAPYREFMLLREERKRLLKKAGEDFEEKRPEHGSLEDYKQALFKHRVSYEEYYLYCFWNLDYQEREQYISEMEMKSLYRKVVEVNVSKWFNSKLMIHVKFMNYMKRGWICPSISSFDSFRQFVSRNDCIVKPWLGSLGNGVFLRRKDDLGNLEELYKQCIDKSLLVEECVRACKEIESFHPQSLNTIRVFTISNGNDSELIAAEIRIGIGNSIVDNASAGGIVAAIDLDTGIIISDGMDKLGNKYVTHPDSGLVIKGFVIPQWKELVKVCKTMATVVPETVFAGWDICVLEDGSIELIEVNPTPNVTGIQLAYGQGLKPRIRTLGKSMLGYDLTKLIPFWSMPKLNYAKKKRYIKQHLNSNTQMLHDFIMAFNN